MNAVAAQPAAETARLRLAVRGAVQGVGFRPFIYRVATELGLAGWVRNSSAGVFIEVDGPRALLEKFLLRVEAETPPRSFIQSLEPSWLDPAGYKGFEIRASDRDGAKTALVLPDIATCPDCLREIFDPHNRRYLYPFTNCTHCGPRFSIIEALPYDRANTSMKRFAMCPQCAAEYAEPKDRRFHAQPNACPACGPHVELWNTAGEALFCNRDAMRYAAKALKAGRIIAVKGLGGFHLMADARNDVAVKTLRERKHREEKPLAVMFPSLEAIKFVCEVSPLEERLLRSPEAPIVLLRRLSAGSAQLSPSVAPENPNLGAMLPSTPLHHLLLALIGFPVIATSGNLSDEPICIDEHDALNRLRDIADLFLVHNRPIVRHVDDSIVRVMAGREIVLRRARGYAPLPIQLAARRTRSAEKVLAVGAHLKNSIALAVGEQVFTSQHIGDLETERAHEAFCRVIGDFGKLYDAKPNVIVADAHPEYLSTKFAQDYGRDARTRAQARQERGSVMLVQHHIAHVLSCMAENELAPPVMGVAWDGTGYGSDGTIWGGEFFHVTNGNCERVAKLRPFRLPGGDAAVKEPSRAALGLLFEIFGPAVFEKSNLPPLRNLKKSEVSTLRQMLERGLNSPVTSSMGRLFDAVASLVDLRQQMQFEGQAAMELEFALEHANANDTYNWFLDKGSASLLLNWEPMVRQILVEVEQGTSVGTIARKFHNTLVEMIVAVAKRIGEKRVVLSGGCFQNRYLTERSIQRLREEKIRPYWHQRVPPNDGGIALGQVVAAQRANNNLVSRFTKLCV